MGTHTTEDVLILDFSELKTRGLRSMAAGFVQLCSELWTLLEKPSTPGQARRAKLTINLINSGSFYIHEMNRSGVGGGSFAALVVGCSALESMLMMICLRDREQVVQTIAWKNFAKRKRKHGSLLIDLLPWVELGTLISIGRQLDWFPNDERVQRVFSEIEGWDQALAEEPGLAHTPLEAALQLNNLRNSLHPGHCLRTATNPSQISGSKSLAMVYISLTGLLTLHEESPSDVTRIVLPVDPFLRPLIDRPLLAIKAASLAAELSPIDDGTQFTQVTSRELPLTTEPRSL